MTTKARKPNRKATQRVIDFIRSKVEQHRIQFESDKARGMFDDLLVEYPNLRASDYVMLAEFNGSGIQYRTLRRLVDVGILEAKQGDGFGPEFRISR